jgi:hypothetical protein
LDVHSSITPPMTEAACDDPFGVPSYTCVHHSIQTSYFVSLRQKFLDNHDGCFLLLVIHLLGFTTVSSLQLSNC